MHKMIIKKNLLKILFQFGIRLWTLIDLKTTKEKEKVTPQVQTSSKKAAPKGDIKKDASKEVKKAPVKKDEKKIEVKKK